MYSFKTAVSTMMNMKIALSVYKPNLLETQLKHIKQISEFYLLLVHKC